MKTNRLLLPLLVLAAVWNLAPVACAADHANIQGILITASNETGPTDGRLAAYEPTLRRILRFESYRFVGEDTAAIAIPSEGRLSIGDGHQLELMAEHADGKTVQVKVRWLANGRSLMSTGLVLRPGVPAVLGGPATGHKGEVYAVILIGR